MRHIRSIALTLGLALFPAQALAQGSTGNPMMDVGQVLRQAEQPLTYWHTPPSPLTRLSRVSRDWMRDETKRQIAAPTSPLTLMVEVDKALGADIRKMSRRQRINQGEITTAIVLKIVIEAEQAIATEAKSGTPESAAKLKLAETHRKEVVSWSTENILLMAAM